MVAPKFVKIGNVEDVIGKTRVPIAVGDIGKTLEVAFSGLESAGKELQRIVAEAQRVNVAWSTKRLEDLHKDTQDPTMRFVDIMLVREDGRVLVNDGRSALYSSFLNYAGYPKMQPPPNIGELLDMVLQKGMLLYPLMSRRYVWMFCRQDHLPQVLDVGRDVEVFPYSSEFVMGFVPDDLLKPAAMKKQGITLGDLGLWAISEKYVDIDKGNQDRTVGYKPRVYIKGDRHPLDILFI